MATITQKAYAAAATPMTTELNALAAAATVVASTATDNSSNLDIWADVELSVTYAVAPTAGTTMDLYLIPSIDGGSVYADGSSSIAIAKAHFQGGFELRAVATLQKLVLRNIQLPPGKFFYALINNGGQALTASGHTLRHATHNMTSA